jgi:hypothetical protein
MNDDHHRLPDAIGLELVSLLQLLLGPHLLLLGLHLLLLGLPLLFSGQQCILLFSVLKLAPPLYGERSLWVFKIHLRCWIVQSII